jgi:hypothetical protein
MHRSLRTAPGGAQTSERWIDTANESAGRTELNMNDASSEVAAASLFRRKRHLFADVVGTDSFLP